MAWIALKAARAPYKMEEVPLCGPNGKPVRFWKLNPEGQLRVLVFHGGAVIHKDSDQILDESGNAVEGGSNILPKIEDSIPETTSEEKASFLSSFVAVVRSGPLNLTIFSSSK